MDLEIQIHFLDLESEGLLERDLCELPGFELVTELEGCTIHSPRGNLEEEHFYEKR